MTSCASPRVEIATYVEQLRADGLALPTVKKHLAAVRLEDRIRLICFPNTGNSDLHLHRQFQLLH